MDQLPLDGRITDLRAFARLGEEGVDLFLTDSTNAEVPGLHHARGRHRPGARPGLPEEPAADHRGLLRQPRAPGPADPRRRASPTTARSAYVGRSMVRNMAIARDLGYLTVPPGVLVDVKDLADLPPERQVLVSTGSQGEPLSALSRIAQRNHHLVHIEEGDTVILASSLIPGNENAVYRVINGLSRWGANVVHKGNAMVHVSGHASAGELLYAYNIVRPRNVMPVHGEIRHMRANAALARLTGMPPRTSWSPRTASSSTSSTGGHGGRQGRLRLRVRRRLLDRRRHRVVPEGPAHPGLGGLHLGDRRGRLGERQGRRRSRDPRARLRRARLDVRRRSSSRSSTRSTGPGPRATTTPTSSSRSSVGSWVAGSTASTSAGR